MKALKVRCAITFNWWRVDGADVREEHADALRESAFNRIWGQVQEGYTSGELLDNIRMDDADPEEGIEYRGHWEVKEEDGQTTNTD